MTVPVRRATVPRLLEHVVGLPSLATAAHRPSDPADAHVPGAPTAFPFNPGVTRKGSTKGGRNDEDEIAPSK